MVRKTIQSTCSLSAGEARTLAVLFLQSEDTAGYFLAAVRKYYQVVEKGALCSLVDYVIGAHMARGDSRKEPAQAQSWTTFVEVSLAGVSKEEIDGEYGDANVVAQAIDELTRSGYRLGLSYNGKTRSFVATLTCKADESPNKGCTLSAHAGDWWFAFAVLCYKHFVVAKEDWTKDQPSLPPEAFG